MNISELRNELAKKQNSVLIQLFSGLSKEDFDTNIDLSMFPVETLYNFWLYTCGFLSVQNFDDLYISEEETQDILNGKFFLKNISFEELKSIVDSSSIANKSMLTPRTYYDSVVNEIQDGKYIARNLPNRATRSYESSISLETKPLRIKITNENYVLDKNQILSKIRNIFAHSTPIISGLDILLFNTPIEIVASKMWIRGFFEYMVLHSQQLDSSLIERTLKDRMIESGINLNSPQEIDATLSLIKNEFDPETVKNYFRINNFIKSRIPVYENFYDKSVDEKAQIIANLISKNPNYISGSSETINPSIVYNIIQIVSNEIGKREGISSMSTNDIQTGEIDALIEESDRVGSRMKELEHQYRLSPKALQRNAEYRSLKIRRNELITILNGHISRLKNIQKQESSAMEMFDTRDISHLSVEVAFNLVCMLGFNSLNTSAFFEDMINFTDIDNLNPIQKKLFAKFDFSNFKVNLKGYKYNAKDSESNVHLLIGIRNALSHGRAKFRIPNLKKGEKLTVEDIIITLQPSYEIEGKLIDFYKLFTNPTFFAPRPKEAYTGNPAHLEEFEEADFYFKMHSGEDSEPLNQNLNSEENTQKQPGGSDEE